jgi:hypothetical protein
MAQRYPISLVDFSERERIWNKHKVNSDCIAQYYASSRYSNYGSRITGCSRSLEFELVSGDLKQGWTTDEILQNYPGIRLEDIYACFSYASTALKAEKVYAFPASIIRLLEPPIAAIANLDNALLLLHKDAWRKPTDCRHRYDHDSDSSHDKQMAFSGLLPCVPGSPA